MVMYDNDSNAILVEPNKNSQAATSRDAFLNIHKLLKERGSDPEVYIMNNECSSHLKEAMKMYEIDFQLAPSHMHRKNAEEREIRTGLSTTDTDLPIIK